MKHNALMRRVAAYIVAQVIMNQESDNLIVPFSDIEENVEGAEHLTWTDEVINAVVDELFEYPQFSEGSQIETDEEGFDCVAWTDYTVNGYADDDTTADEYAWERYLRGEYEYADYVAVCEEEETEPLPEVRK